MKLRTSRNHYRLILQWTVLALLAYILVRPLVDKAYVTDVETYCPLGGMQAFASLLVNNSLACNMSETQIFLGVFLLAGVLAFSKLFCAYVCPVGTFTEWLGRLGDRWKLRRTIRGLPDRLLRVLKYGLLFITLYFTVEASELFCRTFDPYYAVLTGFSADVVPLYAVPAILIVIAGSIFVRQFWCKYLCPIGAVSNIFMNAAAFLAIFALWFALPLLDIRIGWIWPAAAACTAGFILESVRMKGWIVPGLRITRNVSVCTDCLRCNKACPMGIRVASMERVDHIDCHLCGDCITACHEQNTMGINRRRMRWVPAAATVGLTLAGLLLASRVELPTLDLKWGPPEKIAAAAMFEQTGLKSVKCFGSSQSFATRMREVPGILGVKTYVRTNTVTLLYDPAVITPDEIRRHIFTPVRTVVAMPAADARLAVVSFGVEKLFDTVDMNAFVDAVSGIDGVVSIETRYGEPVVADVCYDPALTGPDRIRALIEHPAAPSDGAEPAPGFPVLFTSASPRTLTGLDFQKSVFTADSSMFNDYARHDRSSLAMVVVPFPQGLDQELVDMLPNLVSHLSNDPGVVRVDTRFPGETPELCIYYVRTKTTASQVMRALKEPNLQFTYDSGKSESMPNPFTF